MKHQLYALLPVGRYIGHSFFLCLITFTFYTAASAQPIIRTQRTIGGNESDFCRASYLTNDGGVIAAGFSYSDASGQKTENSRGASDLWIVKSDSIGQIQWDKTIGGSSYDEVSAVQQTSDGGYILGGGSQSDISGEKTDNNRGGGDAWIVKLGNAGNIEWDKTIGGNGWDDVTSLQQTTDGGYILGGFTHSDVSGEITEGTNGESDFLIVKLDAAGNIEWERTIGGDSYDYGYSVLQTGDGGYIIGGDSYSTVSGDRTASRRGGYDMWIVKLDAAGNILWDKAIGGSDDDFLRQLIIYPNGGYIAGGLSFSNKSGEKTQFSRGDTDYWIVKLDNALNVEWDRTIGGNQHEDFSEMALTKDGGLIVGGGSFSNISGEKTENNRGGIFTNDYWVVKLGSKGGIQWDKTIGGSGYDVLYTIKEVKRNEYLLGGESSSDRSGDKTSNSRLQDWWFVGLKYKNENSIAVSTPLTYNSTQADTHNSKNFTAYPNPAKNILNIHSAGKALFVLTDESGKVVLSKTINGNGVLHLSNIRAGVYYLKNTATGITQKIVVVQ